MNLPTSPPIQTSGMRGQVDAGLFRAGWRVMGALCNPLVAAAVFVAMALTDD